MDRRGWRGLLAAAAVLGVMTGLAIARTTHASPDLNGQWKLDPARSSAPFMGGGGGGGEGRGSRGMGGGMRRGGGEYGGMGGGMRRGGSRGGEGRGEGAGGEGGARGGQGGGARPMRLPDLMHVTQTLDLVSFEDSTGKVLQEITTVDAQHDTLLHSPGALVLHGAWSGDTLVVARDTPMGRVDQSYWLAGDGRSLTVRTHMAAGGDRPEREFRRVYVKVEEQ